MEWEWKYLLIAAALIPCFNGVMLIVSGLKVYRSDESIERNVRGDPWFLATALSAGLGRIGIGTWIAGLALGFHSHAWLVASVITLGLLPRFLGRRSRYARMNVSGPM